MAAGRSHGVRFLLPLLLVASLSARAADRPNVVVLLSDDLGWKDIGCYGGPVKTPALDGLAAQGTRFTNYYAGCAVCSPSRATLLTGRHHIRTGVYSWIHDESQRSHLLEREVTLAEVLKANGYTTAHIGKWHLGLPTAKYDKPTPADHGFDHWFATWNNAEPSHHNPENFIRNGEPVGKIEGYSCQIVADEAIRWLEEERDQTKPFFLNIWFHEPHAKIAAPEDIVSEYGKPKDQGAVYSATIDNEDRAVARLLAKLKQVAPVEDTLIVYASDNGSYRDDRVGHLRGKKGVNWEGGIRVPGIWHWPGHLPAGRVDDTPAGVIDTLPTVCGLLGIDKPQGVHLDGSDLSPLLRSGDPASFTRHQPLFWHLQKSRPIVAMRDGRYSLVAEPDFQLSTDNMFQEAWIPAIKNGSYINFQLFDLEADPSQQHDIASSHPQIVERLKEQMLKINASIMADGPDWHLP
ncbi:MAG: sulfatase-like hydrolase/transferase [Verrucomicrobiales bacterium]|nr:sulfatase-like hydrolase/transferase [Verrucomicrobiales bacterium]